MVWSADFPADDWKHINSSEVLDRALRRIEAKGKGILLLHDIQPATALALPALLRELKARGYRIVHVVPAGIEQPKTATAPQEWILARSRQAWPRVLTASRKLPAPRPTATTSEPAATVEQTTVKPQRAVAPVDSLDSTQSISVFRARAKLRLSRPNILPPLVISN